MNLLARLRQAVGGRVSAPPRSLSGRTRIEYERPVPAAWQAALDAATWAGPGTARLWLTWLPGDPWQPVHRWILFQLQPWALVSAEIQRELRGPHPRTNARLEYAPRTVDGVTALRPSIRGGPCRLVDRLQWVTHRDLERRGEGLWFPRYCWVIQGDHGGHPFQVTDSEAQWRRANDLPPDVPSAGDEPYAPFDGRVLAALTRYDLWRYAHGMGDPMTAAAKAQIARQDATEREANRLVWGRKEAVAQEIADGLAFAARQDGLHYHRWSPVRTKEDRMRRATDMDRLRDQYINDTTFSEAVA